VNVGHLFQYADLVVVEIGEVSFTVFGCCQRLVPAVCSCLCRCTPAIGRLPSQTKWVRFGPVLIQASLSWRSLERLQPNGS